MKIETEIEARPLISVPPSTDVTLYTQAHTRAGHSSRAQSVMQSYARLQAHSLHNLESQIFITWGCSYARSAPSLRPCAAHTHTQAHTCTRAHVRVTYRAEIRQPLSGDCARASGAVLRETCVCSVASAGCVLPNGAIRRDTPLCTAFARRHRSGGPRGVGPAALCASGLQLCRSCRCQPP